MNIFNFNKATKILILILILGIILLGLLRLRFKQSTPEKTPSPVVSFTDQKQLSPLPSQNINYSNPSVSSDPGLGIIDLPQSLPLYQKGTQTFSDQKAKQIASSFNIEDNYSGFQTQSKLRVSKSINGDDVYIWVDDPKFLMLYPTRGTFEYSSEAKTTADKADDDKAKEMVTSFLTKNELLPNDYQILTEHLILDGFIVTTESNFTAYRIYITPKVEGLPLISYKNSKGAISFILNRDFSFFKIDYLYKPLEKASRMVTLKKPTGILSDIDSLKVKPSFIEFTSSQPEITLEEVSINKLNIKNIDLVYYFDDKAENTVIYPAYRVSGSFETTDKLKGTATFILPAN